MQTRNALTLTEALIAFVINATMVMEPTVHEVRNKFLILKSNWATFLKQILCYQNLSFCFFKVYWFGLLKVFIKIFSV